MFHDLVDGVQWVRRGGIPGGTLSQWVSRWSLTGNPDIGISGGLA